MLPVELYYYYLQVVGEGEAALPLLPLEVDFLVGVKEEVHPPVEGVVVGEALPHHQEEEEVVVHHLGHCCLCLQ